MTGSLGQKLATLRKSKGLTQAQVGELIGRTKATINAYEHGTNTPPLESIMKLAVLYGVTSDYLLRPNFGREIVIEGLNDEQTEDLLEANRLLVKVLRARHGRNKND